VEFSVLRNESDSHSSASQETAGGEERTDPRVPGGGAPPSSLDGTASDSPRHPAGISRHGESHGTVARNAFYLVVGQVVTTALAIVLSAALGRSLGARDFGLYYLISTMSTFAYVFVEWGQPYFVIRQVARDPLRSGDLLGTGLAIRVALAMLVLAPAGLVAWLLGAAWALAFALALPLSGIVAYRYWVGAGRLTSRLRLNLLALTREHAARRLTAERQAIIGELERAKAEYLAATKGSPF